MAYIIKQEFPHLIQPQYPVALNPDYAPYVSSARLWSLAPGAPQEVAINNLGGFAKTGSIDRVASIGGVGVKGDGSTGLYSRTVSVVPQAMWIAVQFVCNSVSAAQKVVYGLGSDEATLGAYCAISSGDSASSNMIFQLRAINSSVTIGKTGPVPVVGTTYTCIAVFPSNLKADAYAYVNGVKYTTDFSGSSDITFVGANTLVHEAVGALKRGTTAVYSSDTVLFTDRGIGQIPEALAKYISLNSYKTLLTPYETELYISNSTSPTVSASITTDVNTVSASCTVSPTCLSTISTVSNTVSATASVSPTAVSAISTAVNTVSASVSVSSIATSAITLASNTVSATCGSSTSASAAITLDVNTLSASASVSPITTSNLTTAVNIVSASVSTGSSCSANITTSVNIVSANASVSPVAVANISQAVSTISASASSGGGIASCAITTEESFAAAVAQVSSIALMTEYTEDCFVIGSAHGGTLVSCNTTFSNSLISASVSSFVVPVELITKLYLNKGPDPISTNLYDKT